MIRNEIRKLVQDRNNDLFKEVADMYKLGYGDITPLQEMVLTKAEETITDIILQYVEQNKTEVA